MICFAPRCVVCLRHKTYNMRKPEVFDKELQELAKLAQVFSNPARLAILKYLAETKTCISGDISDKLPLSRTTVSQHLKELRDMGLIHGEIHGLKINYCLCGRCIEENLQLFDTFFKMIKTANNDCQTDKPC
jgi:ArsR family transcriptional regulator, arsenate/arsenite/antimonite-responsive transcriptional repressor